MILYRLEYWATLTNCYLTAGVYNNLERANIIMNKHYFQQYTRRLISVETKIISKMKGKTR